MWAWIFFLNLFIVWIFESATQLSHFGPLTSWFKRQTTDRFLDRLFKKSSNVLKGCNIRNKSFKSNAIQNVFIELYDSNKKKTQKYINKKLLTSSWLRLINVPVDNSVKGLYFYWRSFQNNILVKVHCKVLEFNE